MAVINKNATEFSFFPSRYLHSFLAVVFAPLTLFLIQVSQHKHLQTLNIAWRMKNCKFPCGPSETTNLQHLNLTCDHQCYLRASRPRARAWNCTMMSVSFRSRSSSKWASTPARKKIFDWPMRNKLESSSRLAIWKRHNHLTSLQTCTQHNRLHKITQSPDCTTDLHTTDFTEEKFNNVTIMYPQFTLITSKFCDTLVISKFCDMYSKLTLIII